MARYILVSAPFDLALTLTMGQAFRWRPLDDGWFSGVVGPHLFHVRQTDTGVEYDVAGLPEHADDADESLRRYFRLDDDIDAIYASIARDPKMDTIMREFPGLRLLRQDPWECLLSQLGAARPDDEPDDEPLETAAKHLGSKLELEGEVLYTFPTLGQLLSDHRFAHLIWKWLLGSDPAWNITEITKLAEDGETDWSALRHLPYEEVKQKLRQFPGVSDETADRISLFALDKLEAFPLDCWVWRAVTEAYPEWGFPEKAEPTDRERREVAERARQEFGTYAGYANQYLFHWRRLQGDEPLPFGTRWRGKFRITPPVGRQLDNQYLEELRHGYLKAKYLPC